MRGTGNFKAQPELQRLRAHPGIDGLGPLHGDGGGCQTRLAVPVRSVPAR